MSTSSINSTGSTISIDNDSKANNNNAGAGAGAATTNNLLSQIPGNPSFRNAAVNVVAVVPLLSSSSNNNNSNNNDNTETTTTTTHSTKSFYNLMKALQQHHYCSTAGIDDSNNNSSTSERNEDLLLVVPNSSLTRPGDWRYNDTPLASFHWQHGCQRLCIIDGRPELGGRKAHDRLFNFYVSKDWIDLYPHRRTAAVIGVLDMNDCETIQDLYLAEQEIHTWAKQYSTPPYIATAHGQIAARDTPVVRLFVYNSFSKPDYDVSKACTALGSNRILAFPPDVEGEDPAMNRHLINLHLNVVINDLAVAIFRDLENKIKEYYQDIKDPSAAQAAETTTITPPPSGSTSYSQQQPRHSAARRTFQRLIAGAESSAISTAETSGGDAPEAPSSNIRNLTINSMASLVNPESKLAKDSPQNASTSGTAEAEGSGEAIATPTSAPAVAPSVKRTTSTSSTTATPVPTVHKLPRLLTPLDDEQTMADALIGLNSDAVRKRDLGRREKWCGDLSLLAGSPLDAYEHYLKAAELLSSASSVGGPSSPLDPLWHATALEGCAAAHIAMADCGGYNVDEYLENNFQLPDEVMTLLMDTTAAAGGANAAATREQKRAVINKQTLPEVVFTLCDEALNILNRNQVLSHLYAELLLKLALYCSDAAESHLRCQWGEGYGCYTGITNEDAGAMMMMHDDGEQIPRWKKTSSSKLLEGCLTSKTASLPQGMGDMATVNTVFRTKKVCELLHSALAIGTLDPATRIDVAAQCTVMCLTGVKPTHWRGQPVPRIQLPRKAAFFSVVAAEAISLVAQKNSKAQDLWLLSTRLYAKTKNPSDGRGGNYGWASLRAHCLEALSVYGDTRIGLEASVQLLTLLSELAPEATVTKLRSYPSDDERMAASTRQRQLRKKASSQDDNPANSMQNTDDADESADFNKPSSRGLRSDFGLALDENEIREAVANAAQFARNVRDSYKASLTNVSTLLAMQSKSAVGEPIPTISLPLVDLSSRPSAVRSLKCVWPAVDYEKAAYAQTHCMDRIGELRRSLATISFEHDLSSIYGTEGQELPLYVSSAMAIQADPALEMQCVKKKVAPKEGAMATFYNPYESKKNDRNATIRVAEEEERAMWIGFGNKLSLPLEVKRSQLEFVNDKEGRVKAASLSFIIPPRAKAFTVQFPFTVLSKPSSAGDGEDDNSAVFEVKGLDLTCFGRSFFLPIQELSDASAKQTASGNLPESASLYPYRSIKKPAVITPEMKPKIETFPCQPRLNILVAETGAPVERMSIGLSEGEIFTLPTFRLENYMGPSGRGKVERLEIISANVPGTPDKKLYDSDAGPTEEVSEAEFVKEIMWKEDFLPPLKLRALTGALSKNSINGSGDGNSVEEEANVTFQIAAAHNLGEKLPKGATIYIRFRYRGLCNATTEVWRKRELVLHIKHAKGPRISSIAFRPDLARDSSLAEMSQTPPVPKPAVKVIARKDNEDERTTTDNGIIDIRRMGLDNEINVCDDKAHFVLTVSNETKSVVSLERINGPPLQSVTVRPGVSAKIPFVIDRIRRVDEKGQPVDIVAELLGRTWLVWKSHRGGESGPVKARGNVRIPPACLKDIIIRHPSFLSHVCQAPCLINLFVGKPVTSNSELQVSLGQPVDVSVEVILEPWVSRDLINLCDLTIEFRCGRKLSQGSSAVAAANPSSRDYFWAGKIRHSIDLNSPAIKHRAKIAFCASARYAVSACAKFSQKASKNEEVWWASVAQTIIVEESKCPEQ